MKLGDEYAELEKKRDKSLKMSRNLSIAALALAIVGLFLLIYGCTPPINLIQPDPSPLAAGILVFEDNNDYRAEVVGRQFVRVGQSFVFTVKVHARTRLDVVTIEASAPSAGVHCAMIPRINVPQGVVIQHACQGQQNSVGEFSATANVWVTPHLGERGRRPLNFVMTGVL